MEHVAQSTKPKLASSWKDPFPGNNTTTKVTTGPSKPAHFGDQNGPLRSTVTSK